MTPQNSNLLRLPGGLLYELPVLSAPPFVLASRGKRLGAAILNVALVLAAAAPQWLWPQVFGPVWLSAALLVGLLIYQAHGVATVGQSLGKKAFGIRIERLNGALPGFWRGIVLRGVLSLASLWPLGAIVALVDHLAIFGPDQRCLHDQIAGTRVVDVVLTDARRARAD